MKISFSTEYNKKNEVNGKYYIEIPINVWEVFNQKGRIKSECVINGFEYITSLIPKGEGKYVFQLTKKIINSLSICSGQILGIEIMKIVSTNNVGLVAVSKKHMDKIEFVEQTTPYSCGQSCMAMLLNKSIDDIFNIVGKRPLGIGKIVETLNLYGISNSQKNIRISKKNPKPSELSILTLKKEGGYHYVLYFKGDFYDPSRGILDEIPTGMSISSYLEIYTE